jgi:hypothetical protein
MEESNIEREFGQSKKIFEVPISFQCYLNIDLNFHYRV